MFKYILIVVTLFASCKSSVTKPDNNTAIECANSFIHAMFQGNFDAANTIMVQNEANKDCLQKRKFSYNQLISKVDKQIYKAASITIKKEADVSETEKIYSYKDPISNTNAPALKVIKKGEEWLVDYSYSCSGNL